MVLSKKAQGVHIFVFMMVAVMAFIMAIAFAPPLIEQVTITTNTTNLNCASSSISTVNRATCTILDMGVFYFICAVIAAGIAFMSGKRTALSVLTVIATFMATVALITPLKELIILLRDTSHLSCGVAGINIGASMACIFVDLWLFWFVAVALGAAASIFISTKVMGKNE